MDTYSRLPFQGKLRRLARPVDTARDKLVKAMGFVSERNDTAYFDLMAPRLCRTETLVFAGYLMLRDALKSRDREVLAERFVLGSLPKINADCETVTSGDVSLVDNHDAILAL